MAPWWSHTSFHMWGPYSLQFINKQNLGRGGFCCLQERESYCFLASDSYERESFWFLLERGSICFLLEKGRLWFIIERGSFCFLLERGSFWFLLKRGSFGFFKWWRKARLKTIVSIVHSDDRGPMLVQNSDFRYKIFGLVYTKKNQH